MIIWIIKLVIAFVIAGWFLHLLNKCPGEIYRLKELREEKPDLFWAEFMSYCLTWIICLVLVAVLVVPFAMQMVSGWKQIGEFITGF